MDSTTTITNTLSKEDVTERTSVVPGAAPGSISDEEIRQGEKILGTYEVISGEHRGGMGSVWQVRHEGWNAVLAMKRPQKAFFEEAGSVRKKLFISECENWIRLGLHPNIVTCYYVREISGVPTIFAEWMDGGSLKERIADGTLYEGEPGKVQERLLDIAIQTARGIRCSHGKGLVHQDIKPGNILLSGEWEAKVADFGLAAAFSAAADVSSLSPLSSRPSEPESGAQAASGAQAGPSASGSGSRWHTPAYSPREQAAGEGAALWMDVYAWGLTILEMYLGERPWEKGADAYREIAEKPQILEKIPEALRALLMECGLDPKSPERGQRSWLTFDEIERRLVKIYQEITGGPYPRRSRDDVKDAAGALGNRALSYLDLGKEKEAERLWNEALEADPRQPETVYNYQLYKWRKGLVTDEQAIGAVKQLYDLTGDPETAALIGQMEAERGRLWENAQRIPVPADEDTSHKNIRGRAFSDDGKLTALIGKRDDKRSAYEESDYCCRVCETDTGKEICAFDHGICSGNSKVYFIGGSEMVCIEGVDSYETEYNPYEDCYDTEDVSDEEIRVYSVSSGQKVYALKKDRRKDLFTACGRYMAFSFAKADPGLWTDRQRTIELYDAASGTPQKTIAKFNDPIDVLRFSPDSQSLQVMSRDGFVRIFKVPGGEKILERKVHKADTDIGFLEIAENGNMLTGDHGYKMRLWNGAGRCMMTVAHDRECRLDADGTHVLGIDGEEMLRAPFPDGKERAPWALVRVRSIKEQITAADYAQLLIREAEQAADEREYAKAYSLCEQVRQLPGFENSKEAAALCRKISVYGVRTGLRDMRKIAQDQPGTQLLEKSMSFGWNGKYLLVERGGALGGFGVPDLNRLFKFKPDGEDVRCALSIPMSSLIFVSSQSSAFLINAVNGQVERKLSPALAVNSPGSSGSAAAARDGRLIAVLTTVRTGGFFRKKTEKEQILIWDLEQDKAVFSADPPAQDASLCFTPDGKELYAANAEGIWRIPWTQNAPAVQLFSYPNGNISKFDRGCGLKISGDGKLLLIRTDQYVTAYEPESGKTIYIKGFAADAGFISRSGKLLCVMTDTTVRLMEPEPGDDRFGTELFRLQEPALKNIRPMLTVSPDADLAAVNTDKNGIVLYELEWNFCF